jgi:hypothetical protein
MGVLIDEAARFDDGQAQHYPEAIEYNLGKFISGPLNVHD